MTRRALPKPVEAWAVYWSNGEIVRGDIRMDGTPYPAEFNDRTSKPKWIYLDEEEARHCWPDECLQAVRIVPITPKKRTKRKPKNPSDWKVGISKETVSVNYPPKKPRTKRKEKKK